MSDATETHVELPEEVAKQCEARIDGTEFESVEEYVAFVIRVVVEADGTEAGTASADDVRRTTDDDDHDDVSTDVKDRLASLGYR